MTIGGGGSPSKPKPSDYEKLSAVIAERESDDYYQRLKPVVTQYNQQLARLSAPEESERLQGQYSAGVHQGIGYGVNPGAHAGSGTAFGKMINQSVQRGTGLARASTMGAVDAKARGDAAQENIIKRGRNVQGAGIEGFSRALGRETQTNISKAYRDAADDAALWGGVGQAIGTGVGAYGAFKGWGGTTNEARPQPPPLPTRLQRAPGGYGVHVPY